MADTDECRGDEPAKDTKDKDPAENGCAGSSCAAAAFGPLFRDERSCAHRNRHRNHIQGAKRTPVQNAKWCKTLSCAKHTVVHPVWRKKYLGLELRVRKRDRLILVLH